MQALLIVAHGSKIKESNTEIRLLTQRIAQLKHNFAAINCAFLELTKPLIPESIDNALARGIIEIIILPYFLAAGRHITKDIPNIAEKIKQQTSKSQNNYPVSLWGMSADSQSTPLSCRNCTDSTTVRSLSYVTYFTQSSLLI